jgi:hypothetical protein
MIKINIKNQNNKYLRMEHFACTANIWIIKMEHVQGIITTFGFQLLNNSCARYGDTAATQRDPEGPRVRN